MTNMHPIFMILNALNTPEKAIEHKLENANAVRNYVAYNLMDYYLNVEILANNLIVCSHPVENVSPYEKVFIRCLGTPYPKQVRDFQIDTNVFMKSWMKNFPPKEDDKRTPLQRFERILVATELSEACKQLLWKFHIDYIYFGKLNKVWVYRYTGRLKSEYMVKK